MSGLNLKVLPGEGPDVREGASEVATEGVSRAEGFVRGRGIRLVREDGTAFLDAASGTFNVPLGYDHPEVVEAVVEQLRRMAHASSSLMAAQAKQVLSELLAHAPSHLTAGWMRDITGSTANECAVQVAQKATGKTDVLSLFLSHHGQTQFTTAISGNAFRRKGFPEAVSPHSVKVPAPYCYRCFYKAKYPGCGMLCVERISDFVEYASSGSVACMLVEPVLGNGGNVVPPPGYFQALNKLCEEKGILLIADEVQTGMGRTGHLFASEALGFKPNIVTLAKGLGGIGVPVAAVLFEGALDVLESHEHSFTSGCNPVALTAASATLKAMTSGHLLANVRRNGIILGELLRTLATRHPCVGDVRGLGYMWGLEIIREDGSPDVEKTLALIRVAQERHQLVLRGSRYSFGNVVKVRPPLIATQDDLEEIVARLGRALADVG
ncbi:aspartate aminotransferase family protein [Myxococcus sp. AB025B]|uniref:aspartate aminotransferase family protein n=1 Tax=Myxococcus TaxID=32 RepID=UPI001143DBBF|nr:aspartate aminotransferase family protein [Myxococcus sp. AB025B]